MLEPWGPYTRSRDTRPRRLLRVEDGWAPEEHVGGRVVSPRGLSTESRGQLHRLRGLRYRSLSICEAVAAERQAGSPVCVPSKARRGGGATPGRAHPRPWAAGPEPAAGA